MIDYIVQNFSFYFPQISVALNAGIFIFIRFLGMVRFAPGFNRKEVPVIAKISFALLFTVIFVAVLKPAAPPTGTSMIYGMLVNFTFGAIIGYVANCIVAAIEAGGDMINMQMGLSSAMVLDPTTQTQTSILGKYIGLLGLIVFINVGGFYWLINAFMRSFEIFPVYATAIPLDKIVNIQYLITITSNVLYIGLQIAAPVLLATLGQDLILGIISKTAPQINVFQLSFLFKPVFGAAILIWIMPILYNVINDYFLSFSQIF
ncbi:MAG: flagellar biosynthetic protein FliR [Candidatus Gastranaerophilales bacterium]|nr:flagellar biosynthetic protein FliR [Candidatus Gastranaerophilales bacterium]